MPETITAIPNGRWHEKRAAKKIPQAFNREAHTLGKPLFENNLPSLFQKSRIF